MSSSGHLAYFSVSFSEQTKHYLHLMFLVHLGTLVAVFLVFWDDVKALIVAAVGIIVDVLRGSGIKAAVAKDDYRKMVCLIIVGSIPAAIMGLIFQPFVVSLFSSKLAVGIFLVATGTILWLGEFFSESRFSLFDLTWLKALCIGIAQGFAMFRGFSFRSNNKLSLLLGLHREDAARFSFLLSIPVILGAGVLELRIFCLLRLTMRSSARSF